MAVNLDDKGLNSVVNKFDLFFIDIWGVIHNGIQLFENSINVLDELENLKKDYVLLTNAPRPNSTVINFLKKMGMSENKCERVYTSGEAALNHLANNCKNLKLPYFKCKRLKLSYCKNIPSSLSFLYIAFSLIFPDI